MQDQQQDWIDNYRYMLFPHHHHINTRNEHVIVLKIIYKFKSETIIKSGGVSNIIGGGKYFSILLHAKKYSTSSSSRSHHHNNNCNNNNNNNNNDIDALWINQFIVFFKMSKF